MPATKGKGGNFDSKKNPFKNAMHIVGGRPKFNQVSDLQEALELLVAAGCAIMLGATRDGGAVVFTILDGDERHRTYCSNDAEFHAAIAAMLEMYSEA